MSASAPVARPLTPARHVPLSPIRRMGVGAPPGTVNLALGEPGWPLPTVARDALARASSVDGPLPYGANTGRADLVGAVVALHAAGRAAAWGADSAHHGADGLSADHVMLTSGSQAALFALFQTYAAPGSAVLVPDPGFVSYPSLARLCGAEPVGYPLPPGGDLDADMLVDTLRRTRHTSLVLLNHPANPTGGTAGAAALARVADACAQAGAVLVSDEVYRDLWLGEPPAGLHGAAGVGAGVVLGSVSKAFGAPGLRVGWAVGAPALLAPARTFHNAMTTAPAQPSQAAALALLGAADRVLPQAREHVRRRWETLAHVAPGLLSRADTATGRASVTEHASGTRGAAPTGRATPPGRASGTRAGFYLWLPLPDGVAPQDTEVFALRVRDESLVSTVPGSAFGPRGAGSLRVSLGGPLDELEEGLRRLAPWWER